MKPRKNGIILFFCCLAEKYFKDDIASSAASLAYYMIFSFFPLILMISMILGYANIDTAVVTNEIAHFVPKDVTEIISRYLNYVAENKSGNILAVSIFFTVVFPVRAVNYIMIGIDRAYGSAKKRWLPARILTILIFSVLIVFTILASLLLLAFGRTIIAFLAKFNIILSADFINMWVYLRFIIMAGICMIVITSLYCIAPSRPVKILNALPGAVASVSMWIIVSALFSFYVEHMSKYSLLFGSIGAIIVLLLWLYIAAVILLMGAEINSVLEKIEYLGLK